MPQEKEKEIEGGEGRVPQEKEKELGGEEEREGCPRRRRWR